MGGRKRKDGEKQEEKEGIERYLTVRKIMYGREKENKINERKKERSEFNKL